MALRIRHQHVTVLTDSAKGVPPLVKKSGHCDPYVESSPYDSPQMLGAPGVACHDRAFIVERTMVDGDDGAGVDRIEATARLVCHMYFAPISLRDQV